MDYPKALVNECFYSREGEELEVFPQVFEM